MFILDSYLCIKWQNIHYRKPCIFRVPRCLPWANSQAHDKGCFYRVWSKKHTANQQHMEKALFPVPREKAHGNTSHQQKRHICRVPQGKEHGNRQHTAKEPYLPCAWRMAHSKSATPVTAGRRPFLLSCAKDTRQLKKFAACFVCLLCASSGAHDKVFQKKIDSALRLFSTINILSVVLHV